MTTEIRRLVIVLACLVLALVVFMTWRGLLLAADVSDLHDDLANLSAAYEEARVDDPQLPPAEDVIDEPAPRDGIDGTDGRDGRDGRDGLTPSCMLLLTQCVGAQGPEGRPPTDEEISAAVVAYLAANPPAGGGEGTVGPAGPGPTDAQIDAAIERYCATHGDCRGPQGPQGEPGTRCDPGFALVTIKIQGDDYLLCKAGGAGPE